MRSSSRSALATAVAALLATREAHAKKIALESKAGSCVTMPGEVYERVSTLLTARGHTVSVVDAAAIDTPAEIAAYDAVVFGGGNFACEWDWSSFDGVLSGYVNGGGGVVVTGWGAYYLASNPKNETYPGLESILPVLKGADFDQAATTIDIVAGHPITAGVAAFTNAQYDNYGGGVKQGATTLAMHGAKASAAAWTVGTGRSVYLGPIYLANWGGYANESLLDGTQAGAMELFLRSVEWAARSLGSPVVEMTPSPLVVGSSNVGKKLQNTFLLANKGDAALDVSALAWSGAQAAEFASGQVVPFSVAAGASKTITVDFTPTAKGARAAKLSLTSNAAAPALEVSGTGTSPTLTAPASVDFGAVPVGTTSAAKSVELVNGGDGPLTISAATLGGGAAARFALAASTFPAVIEPGKKLALSVTFAPQADGAAAATLTVTSDDPANASAVIALAGRGEAAVTGSTSSSASSSSSGSTPSPTTPSDTPAASDEGCGCRTTGRAPSSWGLAAAALAVVTLLGRRRRR